MSKYFFCIKYDFSYVGGGRGGRDSQYPIGLHAVRVFGRVGRHTHLVCEFSMSNMFGFGLRSWYDYMSGYLVVGWMAHSFMSGLLSLTS